jgi:hypothetical protein
VVCWQCFCKNKIVSSFFFFEGQNCILLLSLLSGSAYTTVKIMHLMQIKNNATVMEGFIDQSNASTLPKEQPRTTMMQVTIEAKSMSF